MDSFTLNPLFGIVITLISGWIGLKLRNITGKNWVNPLIVSVVIVILFLYFSEIPYSNYKVGGDFIHMFLGPITVVLAVPLYTNWSLLKKYSKAILSGVLVGSLSSFSSVIILSKLFGLDILLMKSTVGRSVTTPISLAINETLGGNESIAIIAVTITGVFTMITIPVFFKVLKITHPIAKGVTLGTAAHALGTSKALEYGHVEGAMAALSIGLAGVATVFWMVLFVMFGFI